MKYYIPILFLFAISCNHNRYDKLKVTEIDEQLEAIALISDEEQKKLAVDALWNGLIEAERIPFVQDSMVVFFYRGEAESVNWAGDFNGWGDNPRAQVQGINVTGTDLWYAKKEFPADARLDYKIVVDKTNWILDPANPFQQVSGFGPNSELRMSDWEAEPLTSPLPGIQKGTLVDESLSSNSLNYVVDFRIYLPPGYQQTNSLNVIYVSDGQEYSAEEMGSMITVLDNLHHLQKIEATMAVFVSPIDPLNQDMNRRADEFGNNSNYLDFYTEELIPHIEEAYTSNISKNPEDRAILGTSLGGLNATFFGFSRPDVFRNIAIQAPAYWYREEIFDLVKESTTDNPNIFMSVGTIGDNTIDARNMKALFEEKGYEFTYLEVNEGHSWGAWRTQLDDVLIQFFGNE